MTFSMLMAVAGGVGVLLLGMKMMTDGLKLAGGPMLRRTLSGVTRGRIRALLSGCCITALVQSSGAVTIAVIGFINAGFMTLKDAIWVIFGSKVGSTSTSWIVAWIGVDVDIQSFALPLLALGSGIWLFGKRARRTALGEALAGFGLFFLGIHIMQQTLGVFSQDYSIATMPLVGLSGILGFVCAGFVLTFIMQSTSAAVALILTTLASGLIPLDVAPAAIIGANMGTTSAALAAIMGGTPNAKRLALAHILFNLVSGAAAIILLYPLLGTIIFTRELLGLSTDSITVLALFHTAFNFLGVLLLWPMTKKMVRFLEQRFRSGEGEQGSPQFLDNTLARTPALALSALAKECGRMGRGVRDMALAVLRCEEPRCEELPQGKAAFDSLQGAVKEFAVQLSKEKMDKHSTEELHRLLRVSDHWDRVARAVLEADALRPSLPAFENGKWEEEFDLLMQMAEEVMVSALPEGGDEMDIEDLQQSMQGFERACDSFKQEVFESGDKEQQAAGQLIKRLDYLAMMRSMAKDLVDGSVLLEKMRIL